MPVIGGSYNQGIKIFLLDQFADVAYQFGFTGGIFQGCKTFFNSTLLYVADISDLDIGKLRITIGQIIAPAIQAHNAQNNFVTRCILPKYGKIQNGKACGSQRGIFDKLPAVHMRFFNKLVPKCRDKTVKPTLLR